MVVHTHQEGDTIGGHDPNPGPLDGTTPYNLGIPVYGISTRNAWVIRMRLNNKLDAYTVSGRWYEEPGVGSAISRKKFREAKFKKEINAHRGAYCPGLSGDLKKQYGCN
jgi:hypothetical protein